MVNFHFASYIGPQTTHSLHALLHSPQSSVILPSRPPPPNFLSGLKRSNPTTSNNHYPRASTSTLSSGKDNSSRQMGFKESSNGNWSMSYLKKNILKQMMEREEIFKVTRGKFDNVSKRSSSLSSSSSIAEAAEEVAEAVVGSLQSIVGTKTSKKGKKSSSNSTSLKKSTGEEDEHIWVVADTWRSMLPILPQELNPRKDSYVELKARQKVEKSEEMSERERIGLRVVR